MTENQDRSRMTYDDYRAEHEGWAKDMLTKLDQAKNVVDLRETWMENRLTDSISGYVKLEVYEEFTSGIVKNLTRLGLDMESTDSRVTYLKTAIEEQKQDNQGDAELGMHSTVMTGLYRILAGSDPAISHGVKLLPEQKLVGVELLGELYHAAMNYTLEDKYTMPDRFPRKAVRQVTDPTSKFWGFSILTDTWPTRFEPSSGPNVFLWMPTGLVSRETIINNTREGDSDRAWMERNPQYMPRQIPVQEIQLGGRGSVRPVDTANGMAEQFLKSIA